MSLVSLPTTTHSVVQEFFIESLGGAKDPISYLDRFPDTIYTKAIDSVLVRFLYVLLGPVGAGQLRQEYLLARLQFEEAGLSTVNLDNLYTNAFNFARLAEETYSLDAGAALLPSAQRAQILAQDSTFRNRAQDFLKGARAGGTLLGITLAAKSGLNHEVEVIENYRSLYDRYTDIPMGLPYFGSTQSPNEVVVIPRQATPQDAVQALSIEGTPTQGWFTLTYPAGQDWMAIPVTTTAGSNTITVPDATRLPNGVFVTLTNLPSSLLVPGTQSQINPTQAGWNHGTLFAQSAGGSGTTISLTYPPSAGNLAGTSADAPATGNFVAFIGVGRTILLPYDAGITDVQNALTALPLIGNGNILCNGGPLPNQPIIIQFVNQLSNQTVSTILVNNGPDPVTGLTNVGMGGTEVMSDTSNDPIAGLITIQTAGVGTQGSVIAPADEHAMREAVNQIRPLTALITTQAGHSPVLQQPPNEIFTGSAQIEVLRYVTGRRPLVWPPLDATHWIESGVEHEAPRPLGQPPQHYQGFHDVTGIQAYNERALNDPLYEAGTLSMDPYWDTQVGTFSQAQLTLSPGLNYFNSPQVQFDASHALAVHTETLIISTLQGQGIVNGVYPADYLSLPGVTQPLGLQKSFGAGSTIWASLERTEGADYLEIDLGHAQAVNFLYFEASHKPFLIDVAYDILDQSPARVFRPATIAPSSDGQSVTSLAYDPLQLWDTVSMYFLNLRGSMIYTRFIRIGFTRSPNGTVYQPVGQNVIPYSIEVRNLRVGRNVS